MVKLTPFPNGAGYEAELLNIDVPAAVGASRGTTEEAALAHLREQLAQYILELQGIDLTRIVRP